MHKADGLTRCQIAVHYSDDEGYLFIPGHFDEELKFHPLWGKAIKSKTTPDGWFCVGAFGGDTNSQVEACRAVNAGVPYSTKTNTFLENEC